VHLLAEEVYRCFDEEDADYCEAVKQASKELDIPLTETEIGALAYHIASGKGVRFIAAALECANCEGSGQVSVPNGPDDNDWEPCPKCEE
ncbi:MAG TPA: hypothetical protein VJ044_08745, partial [Candidatus Hodarchaeales archaeon]|nr:hypothetical protein [Candidatus Hodarchaeales archaeon]